MAKAKKAASTPPIDGESSPTAETPPPWEKSSIIGGTGGTPFSDETANPVRLAGFEVLVGGVVDGVRGYHLLEDGTKAWGSWHGGPAGAKGQAFVFDDDEVVVAVEGRAGHLVDQIAIQTNKRTYGPFGGRGGSPWTISLMGLEVGGFFGGAGNSLDRIGILYKKPESAALALREGPKTVMVFDGQNGYVSIPKPLPLMPQGVTIEFWALGGDSLPHQTSIFEAHGAAGSRVLNIHLPWSNQVIFWDAGPEGDFDRIEKAAGPAEYKGTWTHWAFVKDVARGEMVVYRDKVSWNSGFGKSKAIPESVKVVIGAYVDTNCKWSGRLAEFRIWDRALTAGEVAANGGRPSSGREPGLVGYWPLDRVAPDGTTPDLAGGRPGKVQGVSIVSDSALTAILAAQPPLVAPSDQILGEDRHEGFTGSETHRNIYRLDASGEVTIGATTLSYQARGDNSSDTNGSVSVSRDGQLWHEVGAWSGASCKEAIGHNNWHRLPLEKAPSGMTSRTLFVRFQYQSGAERLNISEVQWLGAVASLTPAIPEPLAPNPTRPPEATEMPKAKKGVTTPPPVEAVEKVPGLVLDLKLDAIDDGKVLDVSGLDNHATVTGAVTVVNDPVLGPCLNFPGGDDYLTIKDPFRNNEAFSICLWVKPAAINDGGFHGIIGEQDNSGRSPSIWMAPSNGGFHYDSYDSTIADRKGGIIGEFFHDVGQWVHICWVKGGPNYWINRDGALFSHQDAPGHLYSAKKNYHIGKIDNSFRGQIARVRIYDRNLSPAELAQIIADDRAAGQQAQISQPEVPAPGSLQTDQRSPQQMSTETNGRASTNGQEYPYENLVFQGGGVLGSTYAGALAALAEFGILQQIRRVAGTSAGAITAALVAVGYPADEIGDILTTMDFSKFTDKGPPLSVLSSYGMYRGDYFTQWFRGLLSDIPNLGPDATFEDLENNEFPELYVFASDLTEHRPQEFSFRATPDVPIALAVRASMSIPMFFYAVKFPDDVPNDHLYVDGGMLLNFPLSLFDGPPFTPALQQNPRTLGFRLFDETPDKSSKKLTEFNNPQLYVANLFEMITKPPLDKSELTRCVVIDTLGASAVNFKMPEAQKQALSDSGYKCTKRFLTRGAPRVVRRITSTGATKEVLEYAPSASTLKLEEHEGWQLGIDVNFGEQPEAKTLDDLRDHGFRSVINLRQPLEYPKFNAIVEGEYVRSLGMEYANFPTEDLNDRVVGLFWDQLTKMPKPVFVHSGHARRAGAFVISAVAHAQGLSGDQALAKARDLGMPSTPKVDKFIRTFVETR